MTADEPARLVADTFRREAGARWPPSPGSPATSGGPRTRCRRRSRSSLDRWPVTGVPDRPGAWITTTARNRALDVLRREASRPDREEAAARAAVARLETTPPILHPMVDDQLQLIFTCCHPALPRDAHVELTLRLVCGLTVAEIARALLRSPDAVGKRIQRAKAKVRDSAIALRLPPPDLLDARLASVLDCLYLTFTEGYAATAGDDLIRRELCDEAIRLARLVADLLPDRPGPEALLALLLLQDSRRDARLDAAGEVVLLPDQDRAAWDRLRIEEGMQRLASRCPSRRCPRRRRPTSTRRRSRVSTLVHRRGTRRTGPPSSCSTTGSSTSRPRRSSG